MAGKQPSKGFPEKERARAAPAQARPGVFSELEAPASRPDSAVQSVPPAQAMSAQ
jgi:hypothetical protein